MIVSISQASVLFLSERDLRPETVRVYKLVLDRLTAYTGDCGIETVSTRDLVGFMEGTYSHLQAASWNRSVATLRSFLGFAVDQQWISVSPAAGMKTRSLHAGSQSNTKHRAIDRGVLFEFLNGDHQIRQKTLWWLLYDTAARANEVLAINIEDLDFVRRRVLVTGKGGRPETIGWETKTARLLPRYLQGRTQGPLFVSSIDTPVTRQAAIVDRCPVSGRARLSYRRASEEFKTVSGGWTLHQLRHSRLTHLAEGGLQLPLLMAKSRHSSLAALSIYARPTFDAVADATAVMDPARRH